MAKRCTAGDTGLGADVPTLSVDQVVRRHVREALRIGHHRLQNVDPA